MAALNRDTRKQSHNAAQGNFKNVFVIESFVVGVSLIRIYQEFSITRVDVEDPLLPEQIAGKPA
jgi:hypothetical protein